MNRAATTNSAQDKTRFYVHMTDPNVFRVPSGGVLTNQAPSFNCGIYRSISAAKAAITKYTRTNTEAIRELTLPLRFDIYELSGEVETARPMTPVYNIMVLPSCMR